MAKKQRAAKEPPSIDEFGVPQCGDTWSAYAARFLGVDKDGLDVAYEAAEKRKTGSGRRFLQKKFGVQCLKAIDAFLAFVSQIVRKSETVRSATTLTVEQYDKMIGLTFNPPRIPEHPRRTKPLPNQTSFLDSP